MEAKPLDIGAKYVVHLTLSDIRTLRVMVQLAFLGACRGILGDYDLMRVHTQSVAVPITLTHVSDVAAELYEVDRPLCIFEEFLTSRGATSKAFVLKGRQLQGMLSLCTNFKYDERCLAYQQDGVGLEAIRLVHENREVILLALRNAQPVDARGRVGGVTPPRVNMTAAAGKPN